MGFQLPKQARYPCATPGYEALYNVLYTMIEKKAMKSFCSCEKILVEKGPQVVYHRGEVRT